MPGSLSNRNTLNDAGFSTVRSTFFAPPATYNPQGRPTINVPGLRHVYNISFTQNGTGPATILGQPLIVVLATASGTGPVTLPTVGPAVTYALFQEPFSGAGAVELTSGVATVSGAQFTYTAIGD